MDPFAAYKAQQERNGLTASELSIPNLRQKHPRWATIFDRIDTSGDLLLQLDEVTKGFRHILGAGSQVPERQIQRVFDDTLAKQGENGRDSRVDPSAEDDGLDFKYFTVFAKIMAAFMLDHPNCMEEEAKEIEGEQKVLALAEKERLKKEGPDVFALLGIAKPKDVKEAEAKKKIALKHAHDDHEVLVAKRSGSKQSVASAKEPGGSDSARGGSDSARRLNGSSSMSAIGSSIVNRRGSTGQIGLSGSRSGSKELTILERGGSRSGSKELGGAGIASVVQGIKKEGIVSLAGNRFRLGLKRSQASIESTASVGSASLPEPPPEEEEEDPTSPAHKVRDTWKRFSLSSSNMSAKQKLADVRDIHLPDNLPQIRALGKKNAGCMSLRFSAEGSQLAGAFFDGGVRIFDVDGAAQTHCLNLPKSKGGSVQSTEEMERSKQLEEAGLEPERQESSYDDVDSTTVIKSWSPITNIRWQPSIGKMNVLASIDTEGILALWDVPRNGEKRPSSRLAQFNAGTDLKAMTWACDGSTVAVGGGEKLVKIYDVQAEMGKATLTLGTTLGNHVAYRDSCTGHSLKIMSLCAHPTTPEIFVSAGLDRHILLWDVRAGPEPQGVFYGPELAGDSVSIAKDGISVLCGSHRSRKPLEIYDLRIDFLAEPTISYSWRGDEDASEGGGRYTTCLLLGACWDDEKNKTIVAAGERENLGRVYERSSDPDNPLTVVGTVRGKDEAFSSCAVDTHGRRAAFGAADGAVCLVDLVNNR